MNIDDRVRLSRRAVLGGALGGLLLAAAMPARGLAAALRAQNVSALVFDGPALVVAAGGLWRSGDAGGSWTPLPIGAGEITALAAHPDRPGRLVAGTASGEILVSGDGGKTWSASAGLPGAPVRTLAIAAQAPDTLYAAIEGDGLWTSSDAGKSWDFAMDRPYEDGAERDLLTLASVDAGTGMGGIWIYAGTEAGLTRLPDCFCRWQDVQPCNAMDALVAGEAPPPEKPLPEGETVQSLSASPRNGEVIYAGLPSGTWKSTDAGVSWTRVGDVPARLVAIDPANPERIAAVTSNGILISLDGGLAWTAFSARDGERK
jgi:photosystem II stability/assembly factor-like uncharacterized protein